MSSSGERSNKKTGTHGFLLAASIVIAAGALLTVLIPPVGIALLVLWIAPSLIHAWANISRQSRYLPLPWEDQFAAVIVAFILQIPLWLTAGFVGFLLGALAFDLLARGAPANTGGWPLEVGAYFLVWIAVTVPVYIALFFSTLFWATRGLYGGDPKSKRVSIRDAKPIYHPF